MDIALCILNTKNMELRYSGAHNPLYLIRNGELKEIKADKLFVGITGIFSTEDFTDHSIQLRKGDCIYLFSDGYADQKGGPNGKKYFYPPFQRLLIEIHQKDMEDQKDRLEEEIDKWKGDREQIDDMLIFGVKI